MSLTTTPANYSMKKPAAGPMAEGTEIPQPAVSADDIEVSEDLSAIRVPKKAGELWAIVRSAVWSGTVRRLPFNPR